MICGISLLVIYIYTKNWNEPPGMLVFWHILSQTFIDTTISVTGFTKFITGRFLEGYCSVIGVFNLYFYVLALSYIVFLCIEVLLKLHRPMENAYNKRSKIYHWTAHLTSLFFALLLMFLEEVGQNEYKFCFIKEASRYTYLIALPLSVFLPVLITTYTVVLKMRITTQYVSFFVKKHLVFITAYFLIWFPIIIDLILHEKDPVYNSISLTLLSSSGLIMTLVRVLGAVYIKYLSRSVTTSTNNISIAAMINETLKENPEMPLLNVEYGKQSDYVYVFNSISTESALTAIIIFNYSMQFGSNYPLEDKMPPWDPKYYTDRQEIRIEKNNLKLMLLPKSLKSHCNP
jgi:hypothetical protein